MIDLMDQKTLGDSEFSLSHFLEVRMNWQRYGDLDELFNRIEDSKDPLAVLLNLDGISIDKASFTVCMELIFPELERAQVLKLSSILLKRYRAVEAIRMLEIRRLSLDKTSSLKEFIWPLADFGDFLEHEELYGLNDEQLARIIAVVSIVREHHIKKLEELYRGDAEGVDTDAELDVTALVFDDFEEAFTFHLLRDGLSIGHMLSYMRLKHPEANLWKIPPELISWIASDYNQLMLNRDPLELETAANEDLFNREHPWLHYSDVPQIEKEQEALLELITFLEEYWTAHVESFIEEIEGERP